MRSRLLIVGVLLTLSLGIGLEICEAGIFGRMRCRLSARRHPCRTERACCPRGPCDGSYCFEEKIADYYDDMGEFLYATYRGTKCPGTPFETDSDDALEDVTSDPCGANCASDPACQRLYSSFQQVHGSHYAKGTLDGLSRLVDPTRTKIHVPVVERRTVHFVKKNGDHVYVELLDLKHQGRTIRVGVEIAKPDRFERGVIAQEKFKHWYVVKVGSQPAQREFIVLLKSF